MVWDIYYMYMGPLNWLLLRSKYFSWRSSRTLLVSMTNRNNLRDFFDDKMKTIQPIFTKIDIYKGPSFLQRWI